MNVENGIVVRSVAAWLRRRGWIVVPPSDVGAISLPDGGAARRPLVPVGGGVHRPAPGSWPPKPGTYC